MQRGDEEVRWVSGKEGTRKGKRGKERRKDGENKRRAKEVGRGKVEF